MQAAVRLSTWILPGEIEVADAQLPSGEPADVIVLFSQATDTSRRSVIDILAGRTGTPCFSERRRSKRLSARGTRRMGTLIVPATGSVYLDANSVI